MPTECTHATYDFGNTQMPVEWAAEGSTVRRYYNMRMAYMIGSGRDYNHSTIKLSYSNKFGEDTLFGLFHNSFHHFEEVEITGSFSVDSKKMIYGASFLAYAD